MELRVKPKKEFVLDAVGAGKRVAQEVDEEEGAEAD